jgi:quinohemoprotein ethanol dehydrogenase
MSRRPASEKAARSLLPVVAAAACFAGAPAEFRDTLPTDERRGEWRTAGRDFRQTYYSPLRQINTHTAQHVGYAWHVDIASTHGLEATPIVVDGRLFASGPWGTVVAVDAATGASIWAFDPQVDEDVGRRACCGIVNRGVAYHGGTVFVASLDGRLFALAAETGEIRWSVNTIVDHSRSYTITGAPYVAGEVVVIGNSGAEYNARGYVSAYDVGSGTLRWRFFTVPGDPDSGFEHPELELAARTWDPNSLWEVGLGGTAWDGMAYDPELDLLYVGTGNGTPWPRRVRSPAGGDNLFLSSILAINPQTGRLVWHYQTTPADNWDFTATQKLILAELAIEGRLRRVLMQAPKNGFFYVLDRVTGELLSAQPYVPVNWASHVDLQTGRPVETGLGDYDTGPSLVFPSFFGGHNWQPMAYNPGTGLVYIPVLQAGMVWRMPGQPFAYVSRGFNNYADGFLSGRGHAGISSSADSELLAALAVGQPDTTMRGFLRAWDPVRQQTVWEVETSGPWAGSTAAMWNGGGVMSTAGKLVVQGRTTGELYFYAADTGELLHVIDVGASIIAAPASYEVDGQQYIAVLAGLGGALGRRHAPQTAAARYGNEGRILAFRVGGGEVPKRPLRASPLPPTEPPVARFGQAHERAEGALLFTRYCSHCHSGTGGVLDLRNMSREAHEQFVAIVLSGTRSSRGMASFSDLLSEEQVGLIHAYLVDLAWSAYEGTRQ